MGNVKEFREAIANFKTLKFRSAIDVEMHKQEELEYIRNIDNWACVHATKYLPLRDKAGGQYIPTTAMATDFAQYPRNTVHFTLNHVVTSHGYGNWDATPYVVIAPYKSLVELNRNPAEVSAHDTYWSVGPDTGVRLPQNSFVVKPSNDVLFSIGENIATYKTDNFTDEEIQQIESMMNQYDRFEYEKYKNADFEEYEIEDMLRFAPEIVKKMYAASKDKKAFLRGMYEESKFEILTRYLRNAVVKMTLDKMGYRQVDFVDGCDKSREVAKTAIQNGVPGVESNKGHFNSLYHAMAEVYVSFYCLLYSGLSVDGFYKQKNVDDLYNDIVKAQGLPFANVVLDSVINNKPIDFYAIYSRQFKQLYGLYGRDQRDKECKSIAEFDANLDATLCRNAEALAKKHNQWLAQIKQWPGYSEFIAKLKQTKMNGQVLSVEYDR